MTIELSPRALAQSVTNSGSHVNTGSRANTGSLASAALPGRTLSDAPHASDIRISILSDHEWRICDRRIAETNAESVLGYIEKTGGFFEVMRLSATRNLLYYADFEHAVESFSSTVAPVAVSRVS